MNYRSLLGKAALILALLAVAVWLFTPPTDTPSDGRVRVTLGTFGGPDQIAVYRTIVELFEQAHPNVEVILRTPSSGNYVDKLKTELAGRVAPDVTWIEVFMFDSLVGKGVFRPLDEFAANDPEFNEQDYFPSILNAYRVDEHLYALPKSCGSDVLFFNRDHFEELGLDPPDETWTWDDMVRVGKQLTRDLDGDGRVDRFALASINMNDMILQYGGDIFSPQTNRCELDSPPARQALQLVHDLTYVHKIVPTMSQLGGLGISAGGATNSRAGSSVGVMDLFRTGKVSMVVSDLVLSLIFRHAEFNWDVTMQPAGVRHGAYLNGAAYAMNARTEHPQEAWELIKFLAGPTVQKLRAQTGDSLPSIQSIARMDVFMKNDKPPANRQAVIDQMLCAQPPPCHPRLMQIVSFNMRDLYEAIMAEENPVPIDQAISKACRDINLVLEGQD